jgi:chromate transporter
MASGFEQGALEAAIVIGGARPGVGEPPSLAALTKVFLSIGMQSFGGGMSSWIRREVVQKRGWMEERQFLSGLALCQIAPGPNSVNMAVFVGTTLRGPIGALAAVTGMVAVPVVLVLLMGMGFAALHDVPLLERAMAGLGATAIGLNVATGVRMTRKGITGLWPAGVMVLTAVGVGLLGLPIYVVLPVMVPISIFMAWRTR